MVNRPFKDIRPVGPIVDIGDSNTSDSADDNTSSGGGEDTVVFESIDDLPDSPMLKEYVIEQADAARLDVETVINSTPVEQYMKRLGVWEQAVEMNS